MTATASQRIESAALSGAVVVVTRPSASAAPMKRRIVALGGIALALPALRVRGVDDVDAARAVLRRLDADCVIFVSPNAVHYAHALVPGLRFVRGKRVCAIGAGTARALDRLGVRDVLWPRERQDSEGLLALPALARLRGIGIALIDAPGGRDLLPAALRSRGARVRRIHVYERAAARLDRRHRAALAAAGEPLVVQWSSLEALASLKAQLPDPLFARLLAGDCVVSSERIASALRDAGARSVHRAASPGLADMLAASVAAVALHRL